MSHKKITNGFVVQNYVTFGGKHICVSQEFVAGEQVDYENEDGESIDIDDLDGVEVYQSFDMKSPKQIATGGLKFICPKCKGNRLECVMDGVHECEVLNIDADGDFDFGDVDGDFDFGDVDGGDECNRFQCLNCGFTLKNKEDDFAEYNIVEHEEVVEWIKKNCKARLISSRLLF